MGEGVGLRVGIGLRIILEPEVATQLHLAGHHPPGQAQGGSGTGRLLHEAWDRTGLE